MVYKIDPEHIWSKVRLNGVRDELHTFFEFKFEGVDYLCVLQVDS